MKTYSTKANAKRAAKSQGIDLELAVLTEVSEGGWVYLLPVEVTLAGQEYVPPVEENDSRILGEDLGFNTTRCPSCHSEGCFSAENFVDVAGWPQTRITCHHCGWSHTEISAKGIEPEVTLGEDLGMNTVKCPKCGSEELFHGTCPDGIVIHEETIIGCHHCDWGHDYRIESPKPKKLLKTIPREHKSTAAKPCYATWEIAEKILAKNPAAKRKEIIEACVEAGIAFYTARTQFQIWFSMNKK
jgi:predicted nucleic-acid-binding Zn-ribbon protein